MVGGNMNYYEIGQRIRKFRKTCNLSQEQLAEKVGISTTHMSHIETGNTKLSLPVFIAIANTLSVQTDELLHDFSEINKTSAKNEIIALLDTCSPKETYIINNVVRTVKSSLDKYNK